jgi:signal transduction histidine kinase
MSVVPRTDSTPAAGAPEAAAASEAPARSASIRHKLVLVMLATTLTALLVACTAMIYYDLRVYQRALLQDVETLADVIGQANVAALAFDDKTSARENLALLKAKRDIISGALYQANGALFASYNRSGSVEAFPKLPEFEGARITGREVVVFRRITDDKEILGTVHLKGEYALWEHLRSYLTITGIVLVLALLVALGMSAWLQAAITAPILRMRDVAREVVEKRDFSLRAVNTSNDEIGYLANAFNGMLIEIGQRASALERSNESLERQVREREAAEANLRRAEEDLKRLNAELEERVAERTQQLAAANKELESFSYSVSHDLRAPVRAIAGFSKLLTDQHEGELNDEAKRKLGIVRSEAARMGALIDDLLAFSRLGRQSLQCASVDMAELVRLNFDSLAAASEGPKPALRLGSLPTAHCDRSLLAQVWINLLANAIKFSSKKANPTVEVSAISDDQEHIYYVRDNGAGFDPRYAPKLFGVFQRLHASDEFPGTGVGLALVQRIIARHGGRVWAEGAPGEGATFYFTLPRSESDGAV